MFVLLIISKWRRACPSTSATKGQTPPARLTFSVDPLENWLRISASVMGFARVARLRSPWK